MHDPSPPEFEPLDRDPRAEAASARLERHTARQSRWMSLLAMVLPAALGIVAVKRAHSTVAGGVTRTVLIASYAEVREAERALAAARSAPSATPARDEALDAGAASTQEAVVAQRWQELERRRDAAVAAYARRLADPAMRGACGGPEAPCEVSARGASTR